MLIMTLTIDSTRDALAAAAAEAYAAMRQAGELDRQNHATFTESVARLAHRILPDTMGTTTEDGYVARILDAEAACLALRGKCRYIGRPRTDDGRELQFWRRWHRSGGDATSIMMRQFAPKDARAWSDAADSYVQVHNHLTGRGSSAVAAWKATGIF
jgi:hypothetical protein